MMQATLPGTELSAAQLEKYQEFSRWINSAEFALTPDCTGKKFLAAISRNEAELKDFFARNTDKKTGDWKTEHTLKLTDYQEGLAKSLNKAIEPLKPNPHTAVEELHAGFASRLTQTQSILVQKLNAKSDKLVDDFTHWLTDALERGMPHENCMTR